MLVLQVTNTGVRRPGYQAKESTQQAVTLYHALAKHTGGKSDDDDVMIMCSCWRIKAGSIFTIEKEK